MNTALRLFPLQLYLIVYIPMPTSYRQAFHLEINVQLALSKFRLGVKKLIHSFPIRNGALISLYNQLY